MIYDQGKRVKTLSPFESKVYKSIKSIRSIALAGVYHGSIAADWDLSPVKQRILMTLWTLDAAGMTL